MPILSVDLGTKKTGFSISYPPYIVCEDIPTLLHSSEKEVVDHIEKMIDEKNIGTLVVGVPLSSSGSETPQSEWVKKVISKVNRSVEIVYIDESLTSKMGSKVNEKDDDSIAAKILLNEYISQI